MFRVASAAVTQPPPTPQQQASPPIPKYVAFARLAIVPAVVAALALIAWRLGYFQLGRRQELATFAHRVHGLRWSEAAYVVLYAVAIAAVLPASVVTLLGGAVFGAWEGAALAWAGSLLGTLLTHTLARRVMRKGIQRIFGEHRLMRRLRERADTMTLFRLRILPVAPFATLDYLAGLAGASLKRLLAATAIGVVPSVVAYAYVGAALVGAAGGRQDASRRALLIAGVITVAMLLVSGIPMLLQRVRE